MKTKIYITIYRDALNNIVLQEVEEQIAKKQWKSDLKHAIIDLGLAQLALAYAKLSTVFLIVYTHHRYKRLLVVSLNLRTQHLERHCRQAPETSQSSYTQEVSESKHDSDYWWEFNHICDNFWW